MLEKDQSEAENASIPSMYVSKTDRGHHLSEPDKEFSWLPASRSPSDTDERLHGLSLSP